MKKKCPIRFIGVYDYTVILTYLSLICAILGMTRAIHGDYKIAVICLLTAGVFDSFDGLVARTKKNRTEDEKAFGIQLDSLCDVIGFGVFPALICYLLGVRGVLGIMLVCFFCICAVIRLAFFNVLEGKRQQTEGGGNKRYRGMPVTTVAFLLPLLFWTQYIVSDFAFMVMLHVFLLLAGFLFILDFPMKKPSLKVNIVLISLAVATIAVIFTYTTFRAPAPEVETNPIVEEIEDIMEEIYEAETP